MRAWVVLSLLASGCSSADLEVVSVTELGTILKPASIDGRDGGTSGLFKGRSVWVYGDTVATHAGTFPNTWRNNTMSWTTDLHAADGLTGFVQPEDAQGSPREFFPRTAEEQAFNLAHLDRGDGTCAAPCGARYAIWGSGPLDDPERGRALLSFGKVYSEPGEFKFHVVGTSIAIWEDFDAGPTRSDALLFPAEEGEFGIPAIDEGRLYLFSCSGGPSGQSGCRLGRAPLADVLRREAWTFRTRDGWSANVFDAAVLFDASPNTTVHWNAHLRRWLAVYMSWGTIKVRTAERIDGPWSAESSVFSAPESGALHALAHAELQEGGGAVEYISYLAEQFKLLRVELQPRR
jgi:hypothetical protein